MHAAGKGLLFVVSIAAAACASRTKSTPQTAAPQRTMPTIATAPPSNAPSPYANVPQAKRKLLQSALVSSAFGGCWDAIRHAPIVADTVAEDGTPYFAPRVLPIDLNADGLIDPVVEVDRDGDSVRYELYLSRGQCAQHLGTMRVGGSIVGPMGKANGLRTLEVVSLCDNVQRPCANLEHTELVFDGKGWRPGKNWTTP